MPNVTVASAFTMGVATYVRKPMHAVRVQHSTTVTTAEMNVLKRLHMNVMAPCSHEPMGPLMTTRYSRLPNWFSTTRNLFRMSVSSAFMARMVCCCFAADSPMSWNIISNSFTT